jgi:hypothetical protein
VINLKDRVVEVFTAPSSEDYANVRRVQTGEILKPSAFPDIAVPVVDLFPPTR